MKSPRFQVYKSGKEWRWRLRGANGEIQASGEGYTRKADALRGVRDMARSALIAWALDGGKFFP